MSRYIAPADLTMLAGYTLTLCRCVKMTLRDGTVLGYTDHDADLSISSVTYRAKVGLAVGALRWSNRIETEITELRGIFSSDTGGVTQEEARLGTFNQALVEIFLANWSTPALVVPLKRGRISNMLPHQSGYIAEVRSMATPLLQKLIVDEVTRDCTAELGDTRCTAAVLSQGGTISSATTTTVTASGAFTWAYAVGNLVGGKMVLTGSDFDWFVNRIKSYDAGTKTFTFVRPWPGTPTGTFVAYEGCPKTATACKDRFSNLVNFRGYRHVPEKIAKVYKDSQANGSGYQASGGEDD